MNYLKYIKSAVLIAFGSLLTWHLPAQTMYRTFHLSDFNNDNQSRLYQEFVNDDLISAGIYHLEKGAVDDQKPHEFDEVYYVVEGKAKFIVSGEEVQVNPGSLIYVKADVDHSFDSIDETLKVVVVFSHSKNKNDSIEWHHLELNKAKGAFKKDMVIWNPFFKFPNLIWGLYMLPKVTNGDNPLIHSVNELNVVVQGSGQFTVEKDSLEISEGSIVEVSRNKHHYFHSLNEDLFVLIFFPESEEE